MALAMDEKTKKALLNIVVGMLNEGTLHFTLINKITKKHSFSDPRIIGMEERGAILILETGDQELEVSGDRFLRTKFIPDVHVEKAFFNLPKPTIEDKQAAVLATIIEAEKEEGVKSWKGIEKTQVQKKLRERFNLPDEETAAIMVHMLRTGVIYEPREGYVKKTI
jgi:hypothetical protein